MRADHRVLLRLKAAEEHLRDAIEPFVERVLRSKYGAQWQRELLRASGYDRATRPDAFALLKTMKVKWSEFADAVPDGRGGSVRTYVNTAYEARNKTSHSEAPDDADALNYFHGMLRLAEALGGSMESIDNLQRLYKEQRNGTPEVGPEVEPHASAASARSASPQGTPSGEFIYFPIVGPQDGAFALVSCRRNFDKRSLLLVSVIGNPGEAETVTQVVAEVRRDESEGAPSGQPILVQFEGGKFTDNSYGLALALADKLLRFGRRAPAQRRLLIATGQIIANGHGKVGAIGELTRKMELVERDAPALLGNAYSDATFAFPAESLRGLGSAQRGALDTIIARLRQKGIECRAVRELADLSEFWEDAGRTAAAEPIPPPAADHRRAGRSMRYLWGGAAVGLTAVVMLVVLAQFWMQSRPDPMQQERIAAVWAAYGPGFEQSADACMVLIDAVTALRMGDQRFLGNRELEAVAVGDACRVRLAQSDGRIAQASSMLAEPGSEPAAASDSRLVAAVAALDDFDRPRVPDYTTLQQAASEAQARLGRAQQQLSHIETPLLSASANDCRTVIGLESELSPYELGAAQMGGHLIVETSQACRTLLAQSGDRVEVLHEALARSAGAGSAAPMATLLAVYETLTPFDMTDVDEAAVAQVAEARGLLAGRAQRLEAVGRTAESWHQTPNESTLRAMFGALSALTAFDTIDVNGAEASNIQLAQSAKRRHEVREHVLAGGDVAPLRWFVGEPSGDNASEDYARQAFVEHGYALANTIDDADLVVSLRAEMRESTTAVGNLRAVPGALVTLEFATRWAIDNSTWLGGTVVGNGASASAQSARADALRRAAGLVATNLGSQIEGLRQKNAS